jgi:hypothetical protein
MRYVQRKNGEGWAVRNRERFRIACCDCGLVHELVIVVSGKRKGTVIGIAAKRHERATAQKRRVRASKKDATSRRGRAGTSGLRLPKTQQREKRKK